MFLQAPAAAATQTSRPAAPLASKLVLAQPVSRLVAQLKQDRSVACGIRRACDSRRHSSSSRSAAPSERAAGYCVAPAR